MNRDIAKRWIAALRDPNARQAKSVLGTADGARCCLGVLCDLAVAEKVIEAPLLFGAKALHYGGSTAVLPKAVCAWANMKTKNGAAGAADDGGYKICLSEANDSGASFDCIARLIEEHMDEL